MSTAEIANANKVSIYPNPTKDVLNFSGVDVNKVEVYSLTGKLIPVMVNDNVVNTRNLPEGMYIIKFVDANGKSSTKKFIKK